MRLSNHIHIVGTVTNSHRDCLFVLIPHHLNDFSFLLWTHSTRQHYIGFVDKTDEFRLDFFVSKDFLDCFTANNDSHFALDDVQVLLILSNTNLLVDVYTASAIDYVLIDAVIQQMTGVPNIDRSLNLVTS